MNILKYLTIDQIKTPNEGEALEFCRGAWTVFYGNGEITIYKGDHEDPYVSGSVSNARGFDEIVWDYNKGELK